MRRATSLALLVSAIGSGCAGGSDTASGTGTLVIEWSIEGRNDAASCRALDAASLEIQISRGFEDPVTEVEAPCDAFSKEIELFDGEYDIRGTLVDASGEPAALKKIVVDVLVPAAFANTVEIEFQSLESP
jgi:hypothetical protein